MMRKGITIFMSVILSKSLWLDLEQLDHFLKYIYAYIINLQQQIKNQVKRIECVQERDRARMRLRLCCFGRFL